MNTSALLQLPEVGPGLERLEDLLRTSVGADDPFLTEVAGHLIAAGGKRLRPCLAVCSALGGGAVVTDEVLLGGVAVELVHLASLYHDDVMDEASERRGVPSVNARWGNIVAVVSGDFLLARAAGIAARLGSDVAELLADTLAELCEGQLTECRSVFDVGRGEDSYFDAIRGKTASLMATSCRIGAMVSGLEERHIEAVTRFGHSFGMAFQVLDDLLDVVGDRSEIGKLTGQDLAEGIYTLPVIRCLRDDEAGPELSSLLGGALDDSAREKARALVASSKGVTGSHDVARSFIDTAVRELEELSRSDVADALEQLGVSMCDSLVRRAA